MECWALARFVGCSWQRVPLCLYVFAVASNRSVGTKQNVRVERVVSQRDVDGSSVKGDYNFVHVFCLLHFSLGTCTTCWLQLAESFVMCMFCFAVAGNRSVVANQNNRSVGANRNVRVERVGTQRNVEGSSVKGDKLLSIVFTGSVGHLHDFLVDV